MTHSKDDILHGWKDIAAYLSRDVSTVKRWEKQRGLPVRRVPGEGRASVYAHAPELAQWLASAGPEPLEPDNGAAAAPADPVAPPAIRTPTEHLNLAVKRPRWIVQVAFASALLCVAATLLLYRVSVHSKPATQSASAAMAPRYASAISGVEDSYLRGVYSYEKRTPDSLAQAETYFREAIAKDSRYAPAYAGLAVTYNLMREFSSMPSAEAYAKSRFAAEKAIALDPGLSDAHAALGFVEFFWDWKAAAADREFQVAIELDPNSALAHHWYGSMLTHEGRFADAVRQLDIAQRLAPNSTSILLSRALALGYDGHRQQAIDMLRQLGSQDPSFTSVHLRLGQLSLLDPADFRMFFSEMKTWARLNHDSATLASYQEMERAFEVKGEAAMWRVVLRQEQNTDAPEITGGAAGAQAEVGNPDAAFTILRGLAAHHSSDLIGINLRVQLNSLHADPRYNEVLTTMGFPPIPAH
jgi:Tfp pilus assembly protein PilF